MLHRQCRLVVIELWAIVRYVFVVKANENYFRVELHDENMFGSVSKGCEGMG